MTPTNTNPDTPPDADISPSSSETAVYGDREGIQCGSVETNRMKTGILFVSDIVEDFILRNATDKGYLIQATKERIQYKMQRQLAANIADGRRYAVQILPFTQAACSKLSIPATEFTLTATVLLVHASDCEIGECCIDNTDLTMKENGKWLYVASGREMWFEQLEDGSGWRRIA